MYIVAIGNPFDGMNVFGPFEYSEDADRWAQNVQDDYWVVWLEQPCWAINHKDGLHDRFDKRNEEN